MTERDPTCIGKIRQILGGAITVALDSDLAGVAPIYRGRLQPIGQIGALVRIPQGLVELIATVTSVGISEGTEGTENNPTSKIQIGDRFLQVQLLGEIDRGTSRFQRGIGSFPGLDDPVHFATPDDLAAIFPEPDTSHLRIGCLTSSEDIAVCVNASKLVVRHSAVVGSSGSGKTSVVASMLQGFVRGGWSAANIIVIDPHGEYARALSGSASVRSVLADQPKRVCVPYWALPAEDIVQIFAGTSGGATFQNRFLDLVTQARRQFVADAEWLTLDPTTVTADTPVPFDLRAVWHKLDAENRETRKEKGDPTTACVEDHGDASSLKQARFTPYAAGGGSPHKSPTYDLYGPMPERLRLGLQDPRLRFFQEPLPDNKRPDPLVGVLQDWLGGEQPISVLDFNGVPAIAADLAIGVILNLVFEVALRSENNGAGVGRSSPVLIVLEEAHRYLGATANKMTRDSANRIAREGRKYGVGLMLVTQRPTELPETALPQCGTIVALRLSNALDQGVIKAALPDSVAGLASVLPSLRTGEAIISGESLVLPVRVVLDKPSPMPQAEDPSLDTWLAVKRLPNVAPPLAAWRGTYEA